MYQHLGLHIGLDSDAAGASSSAQESSAAGASSSNAPGPSRPHPTSNPASGSRAAQSSRPTSSQQQSSAAVPQPSSSNQQAAAHPQTNPAMAHQGNPATQQQAHPIVQTSSNSTPSAPGNAAQPQVVNELAVLRARIAELECLEAHGNPNLARAPAPQQALVGDPATIKYVRATIATPKEDFKRPTLPVLQPGHKPFLPKSKRPSRTTAMFLIQLSPTLLVPKPTFGAKSPPLYSRLKASQPKASTI